VIIDSTVKFFIEEKGNINEIISVCQPHVCHLLVDDLDSANFRKTVSIESRLDNF